MRGLKPASLRFGSRDLDRRIKSIRDIVLCIAEKQEKVVSSGCPCLQASTSANSLRSFPNLA